jgi:hypothetical protein
MIDGFAGAIGAISDINNAWNPDLPHPTPSAPVIETPTPTRGNNGKRKQTEDYYVVRLQAQGDGLEQSVRLTGTQPITVAQGVAGLEELKAKLSTKELKKRLDCFRRAERFIRNGPQGGGIAPPGQSLPVHKRNPIRVDVEVWFGINFRG